MNFYRFPENRITKWILPGYLFLMLYLCRSTMFCLYVVGFYPSQAIILAATAALGVAFLWYQRRNWKAVITDGRIILAAVLTAAILVPMVIKQDWQFMYFSILLFLYISILMSYMVSWRELAKTYVVMVCVLGVYSILAAYVLRIPVDMELIRMPVFVDGRGEVIYNFFLSIVPKTFETLRNFGMFREPGVYQYFILLALVLAQYGVRWQKERHMWVVTVLLCLTMVSTQATGGLAEMCLLAAFVFFDKKLYKKKWLVCLAVTAVLLVVGVLYYSYEEGGQLWFRFYLMTFHKFVSREDSFTERAESIFVNLRLIRQNPLVGARLETVLHAVDNNTSSSLILFAGFGLISGWLHVLAWGVLLWDKNCNVLRNLILMGIVFLSFNTQNMTWDLFFWMLPVMALTEEAVPRLERRP